MVQDMKSVKPYVLVLGMIPLVFLYACSFSLLPDGSDILTSTNPFVMKGTAAIIDNGGPCLVWQGENGITYHLLQEVNVDNDAFDQATTPGVTSRLQLRPRNDVPITCQIGTIVEVIRVLEIITE